MEQININTPSGNYAAIYSRGVLDRVGASVSGLSKSTGIFVLSSAAVWKHWGTRLEKSFAEHGGAKLILMDDRERAKNLRTVEKLCRALARARADRGCILVAFGGGVVGDVAGFVAASYLRGVRFVQVPTTLVAQVDSAIGGKTGVDLPEGKNLVGAFHQPRLVVVDPEVLRSLPERQYRSGIYEVIKYGVIRDAELFALLEEKMDDLLRRDPAVVDAVIPRCMRVKAGVVSEDERETDLRRILNFGHTVGHALEAATRYRRFLHGEAVGWGMIAATELARSMSLLEPSDGDRLIRLTQRVGTLPAWPQVRPEKLLEFMRGDKKVRAGKLHFVVPRRIGQAEITADVTDAFLKPVLQTLTRFKVA